ncbi:MAG: acylphosphatase [Armatimonadota bacterium]|nr:MAG: acylphosphatase [Armatimonadota bacterium]
MCAGGCDAGAPRPREEEARDFVAHQFSGPARFRAIISGRVQMVGFRAFAHARALALGAAGHVRNLPTGEVEVVAEGDRKLLDEFVDALRRGPSGARVTNIMVSWETPRGEFSDFSVRYGDW